MSAEQKAKNREYYLANKEHILARQAERYRNNKQELSAKSAEYYQENKEHLKVQQVKYRELNKQALSKQKAEYYQENKEGIRERQNKYNKSYGAIRVKLAGHRHEDNLKDRENDINYDYVIELLKDQGGECAHCEIKVKRSWTEPRDPEQFSINRIKNKYGHIEGNIEITCWMCNKKCKRK